MVLCGLCLTGFSTSVLFDVVTRTIGHPWLWLQEVTSTFFTYGIFIGAAVATRRADHLYLTALTETMHGRLRLIVEMFNRLVILGVALCTVYFGFINFLQGFSSFRMPSMTPIASYYAVIPISGLFIAMFTVEQLVNGWRNGFESSAEDQAAALQRYN
ncbi:MAG: TRAP transporter small permease [Alphaproteobacteria bacterium]|nr:TRAP transporter small permease [Alphaproteobacteria bacterium]